MRLETTAETTEVRRHRGRIRVQKSEQRSQEESEGSKAAVQENREGNEGGLQHPKGSRQDPTA